MTNSPNNSEHSIKDDSSLSKEQNPVENVPETEKGESFYLEEIEIPEVSDRDSFTSSGSHSHRRSGSHHSHHRHHHSRNSSSGSSDKKSRKKTDRKKKPKKKMSKKKKILLAIPITLLSLILIAVIAFFILRYLGKLDFLNKDVKIDVIKGAYSPDDGRTVYYKGHKYIYNEDMASIVFLGIDRSELGTDIVGDAGQSDAVYIFSYDTDTGKSYIIPVSRETMADVRTYSTSGQDTGIEKMQLCLAYSYGNGKDTSCENALASLSGVFYNIPFNTYATLNWDGIAPLNDLAGGVPVTANQDLKLISGNIRKGEKITLKGDDARAFVRTRDLSKLESNNDRLDRQRAYLKSYMNKMIPKVRSDYSMISKIYNTASDYTYSNFSFSQIIYTASAILPDVYTGEDIEFVKIKGKVKSGGRYAEFYPDETSLYESILKVFYLRAD